MWRIESSISKAGTFYIIEKVKLSCDCPLQCSQCHVCAHMFTCTCLDATVHSTVCKHIHLVCIQMENEDGNTSISFGNGEIQDPQNEEIYNAPTKETDTNKRHQYYLDQLATNSSTDNAALKESIDELTYQVKSLKQSCHKTDVLKTVKQHLQSTVSLLIHESKLSNDFSDTKYVKTSQIAPNSNNIPQLRFHSTKKTKDIEKTMG